MTDDEKITRVEEIRRDNNRQWMDILRIALRQAPKETRIVLARINFNDGIINRLLKEIAE